MEQQLSETMNVKGQRKVVAVEYRKEFSFKIPDGLDLEDQDVVKRYFVRWNKLHIVYTDKDKQPDIIQTHYGDYEDELEIPDEMKIANAEDYGVEYSDEEEEADRCDTCNTFLEPNCKCNTKCDICNNYLNCECS